jgi:hypothetical protein
MLFFSTQEEGLREYINGNEKIKFYDVCTNKGAVCPGETFCISLKYVSSQEYRDVQVDLAIWIGMTTYFQATNRVFKETINLLKGSHELVIAIQDMQLNNTIARVGFSVWSHGGIEILGNWVIPVEFRGVALSTWQNHLRVAYSTS